MDAARIRAIVDEQAEDEGLWFVAETAPEAYLQQALRKLHEAIDGNGAIFKPAVTADLKECDYNEIDELRGALAGMMGLVTLITARDDLPLEIRTAMLESHRYREAQRVLPGL